MANDVTKITVGKPKIGGAIFRAPSGTALPTDADSALSEDYVSLGYISEDGITNDNSVETEKIKAWGGDTVLTPVTEITDTFEFNLLQVLDETTKKLYFGDNNVSGSLTAGMVVKANGDVTNASVIIIEMILAGDVLHRIVIPNASISERAEITYVDGEAVVYGVTISALPDSEGNTHYEYTKKKA